MLGLKQINMRMLLLIILFVQVQSCKNGNQSQFLNEDTVPKNEVVTTTTQRCDKMAALLQGALDIPAVQQYYDVQKTISQSEFVLEKNGLIKEGMILTKLGDTVQILSIDKIKEKGFKAFVRFDKLSIKGDTANVYFEYPIQGLGCEAVFIYSSPTTCYWKLLKSKLFEYKAP